MIGKTPRRWPSAKAQSEISEPNPYRARHRQPQIIDDGMQPKPTIFALSRACIARGTGSSNPSPSSGESANHRFLSGGARSPQRARRAGAAPRDPETVWKSRCRCCSDRSCPCKSVTLAPANRPSATSNQSSLCATIRHEAVFDPCPDVPN